jgi:serine protease DegQ
MVSLESGRDIPRSRGLRVVLRRGLSERLAAASDTIFQRAPLKAGQPRDCGIQRGRRAAHAAPMSLTTSAGLPRRRTNLSLAIGAAVLLIGGCGTGLLAAQAAYRRPSPTPPVSGQPAAGVGNLVSGIPEMIRRVEPSVVTVITDLASGSGVVWSDDGLIVTNSHVVTGSHSVAVVFADGRRGSAHVVAIDPATDLAVLRSDRTSLRPAVFAPTLPSVGELVVAIGNPLGLENSVTAGIISGLHRAVSAAEPPDGVLVDLIQTDAAISSGNSGGALIDAKGHVVGINAAYMPPETGAMSIGFAIPSATVLKVIRQFSGPGWLQPPFPGAGLARGDHAPMSHSPRRLP